MGLLDMGLLDRARSFVDTLKTKMQLSFDRQGRDLKKARTDLQQALKRAEEAESQLRSLQDVNATLQTRVTEIRKSWDTFQAIASDADKIQKLITAFKRTKRELLEIRRDYDLRGNTIETINKENARFKHIFEEASSTSKIDVVSLLEQAASQKKDISSLHIKCAQQDRLIKSLKEKEEKLMASLKRNL